MDHQPSASASGCHHLQSRSYPSLPLSLFKYRDRWILRYSSSRFAKRAVARAPRVHLPKKRLWESWYLLVPATPAECWHRESPWEEVGNGSSLADEKRGRKVRRTENARGRARPGHLKRVRHSPLLPPRPGSTMVNRWQVANSRLSLPCPCKNRAFADGTVPLIVSPPPSPSCFLLIIAIAPRSWTVPKRAVAFSSFSFPPPSLSLSLSLSLFLFCANVTKLQRCSSRCFGISGKIFDSTFFVIAPFHGSDSRLELSRSDRSASVYSKRIVRESFRESSRAATTTRGGGGGTFLAPARLYVLSLLQIVDRSDKLSARFRGRGVAALAFSTRGSKNRAWSHALFPPAG